MNIDLDKGYAIGFDLGGTKLKAALVDLKGEVVESKDDLRGSWGWVRVEDLDKLYNTIAKKGFIHHYCMTYDQSMDSIKDFCDFTGIETVIV